ncbi:MAG: hypothetical protein EOP43_03410 [Sphingobacteriaceae bacterium]|nr:MAG: hypothetical protein EOP43_03410 [Sphingobacteriaceae bacterium]
MKIFFIALLAIASCKTVKHNTQVKLNETFQYRPLATFHSDTASYIKYNFIERKQVYLNKKINVLIEDLEVPVRYYTDGTSAKYVDSVPYISLKFYRADVIDRKIMKKKDPTILVIHFITPLSTSITVPLLRKINSKWTAEAQELYGKQTIKNIELVDYNFKK